MASDNPLHYGYEVSQSDMSLDQLVAVSASTYCAAGYPNKNKLYWYDSFAHPHIPSLQINHPHHKHIPPDIKQHRVSAPELSFTRPNLPVLIEEVKQLLREMVGDPTEHR